MEYNNPSEIVKDLTFGKEASSKIMKGVEKLANAVSSTLGASGRCVIYEDALADIERIIERFRMDEDEGPMFFMG